MKQLNFLAMSLAIGALSACSDKDDFTTGSETHDAGAYISVALNLPTTSGSSTRAENDKFNDGAPREYEVNDISLLLFAGSDETSATFLNVYNIDNGEWTTNTNNDQITTYYSFVKQIDGYSDNLYALAVLNKNDLDLSRSKLSGKKLCDLQAWIVESSDGSADEFTSGDFFMTNSPLSSVAGGSGDTGKLTVLAEVGETFKTEDEANKSIEDGTPSFNIYVERGVAKVEVSSEKTPSTVKSEDGIDGYTYTVAKWCLDITNTQSYLVRNTSNEWDKYISNAFSNSTDNTKYRFLGTKAVSDASEYYRNYWAIDPNYNNNNDIYGVAGGEDSAFACIYGTNGEPTMLEPGEVDYCFENTFDVKSQKQDETTRVIIGVELKENSEEAATSFYTKGSDKNTIYAKATVTDALAAAAVESTDVLGKLATYISSGTISSEYVAVTISDGTVSSAAFRDKEPADLSYNGSYSWSDITGDADLKSALKTAAQVELNNYSCYKGGMAYYPVRIKHFGDDLTPWNNGEYDGTTYPQPSSDNIYPGEHAAEQYLGRYGVVRNNWYVIEVTGVSGLGYADPTDIETPSSCDDELPEYISAKINILSWAKRTQEAVLK